MMRAAPKANASLASKQGYEFRQGRRPGASGRLYSPGGCGCALLLAPVMAAAIGLAAFSLGVAVLALLAVILAVVLTVREVRRSRSGEPIRRGFAIAATVLYVLSVPYLMFFIWLWFLD